MTARSSRIFTRIFGPTFGARPSSPARPEGLNRPRAGPDSVTFLSPPDAPDVVYEFFAPFAHIPGRVEWCRIRSPTHGVFDSFIVLGRAPSAAPSVYVSSDVGERFMRERYPESAAFRVGTADLRIEERDGGRTVIGDLRSREGPVRTVKMTLQASGLVPRHVPYGGKGEPVWGSKRWTCWGVDLVLDATATGAIEWAEGYAEPIQRVPAIVTLGSFGRIAPLP